MNEVSDVESAPLIKADRVGRSHYSHEFKAAVLEAFEQSSLSGQAFAEQCGIKYPTFASWRAKAKARHKAKAERETVGNPSQSNSASFVVAEFASPQESTAPGLTVTLPGGVSAVANDEPSAQLLAVLIKALA